MKTILRLTIISILGGAITLFAYKSFFEKENVVIVPQQQQESVIIPTNYTTNTLVGHSSSKAPNFITAADKTIDAVVHIKNITETKSYSTYQDLLFGTPSKRKQVGTGSGVIVSPDGYIITNNHVINEAKTLSITLNNNKEYNATLIGSDFKTDIALLKIDAEEDLPYITFGDSDEVKVGEWVLAVGNPFNLNSTVTAGIISAKSRNLNADNYKQSFLQTDAAVNPGNSGGALVNTNGELIGINTAISSQTGSYIGYSFAVPSNIARKVIEDLIEYGNVQNGILGVVGVALNAQYSNKLDIEDTEGFYISKLEEASGAQKAGLREGDIIKKIDDIKITNFSDLSGYLNTKRPNDVVNVTVVQDGTKKTIPVTLFKKEITTLPFIGNLKNATLKDLTKLNAPHGVKIVKLDKEYSNYWRKNGIEEGTIITAINGIKINTIEDISTATKQHSSKEPMQIELINTRGKKERLILR